MPEERATAPEASVSSRTASGAGAANGSGPGRGPRAGGRCAGAVGYTDWRTSPTGLPHGLPQRAQHPDRPDRGQFYGAAVLHDVRMLDPQGVFLTIPARKWTGTRAWLSNRLEIDSFAARRGNCRACRSFCRARRGPILPGFISVEELVIDDSRWLAASPEKTRGSTSPGALRSMTGLLLDLDGRLGARDQVALLVDANRWRRFRSAGCLRGRRPDCRARRTRLRSTCACAAMAPGMVGRIARPQRRRTGRRPATDQPRAGSACWERPCGTLTGLPAEALGDKVALKGVAIDNRSTGRPAPAASSPPPKGWSIWPTTRGHLEMVVRAVRRCWATVCLLATQQPPLDGSLTIFIAHEARGELDIGGTVLTRRAEEPRAMMARWTLPLDLQSPIGGNALVDQDLSTAPAAATVLTGSTLLADDLRLPQRGSQPRAARRSRPWKLPIRGRCAVGALDDIGTRAARP